MSLYIAAIVYALAGVPSTAWIWFEGGEFNAPPRWFCWIHMILFAPFWIVTVCIYALWLAIKRGRQMAKREVPSRQGIMPKNVKNVSMPRSFLEIREGDNKGKIMMKRPFQSNRFLTGWEHVQYFFGKRWFA